MCACSAVHAVSLLHSAYSGPRVVQPAAPVPAGHGPVGRCVCCQAGGDFGPAVRHMLPAPPGQRTDAGKGYVREFHLDDILLVRACKAVLGLQVCRFCACPPVQPHMSLPPPPSLSGRELTRRMVLVFVGLLCEASPLEKTKCELGVVMLSSSAEAAAPPCPQAYCCSWAARTTSHKGSLQPS